MWEVREWALSTTHHTTDVTMKIQIVYFKVLVLVTSSSSIDNGTTSSQRWEPTCIPCVLRGGHHLGRVAIIPPASDLAFSKGFPLSHLMGYCPHLLTVRNLDFMWTWDTSKSYKCANYQTVRTLANKYHHQLQNSTNAMTFHSYIKHHCNCCYETLQKLRNFHFLGW